MWPDRVSNPGPLTYVSGALPTALRGPAKIDGGKCSQFTENDMSAHFTFGIYDILLLQIVEIFLC